MDEAARITAIMEQVVGEAGEDYVYPEDHKRVLASDSKPQCVYVYEWKADCLVGRVLHADGMSLDKLANNEGYGARIPALGHGLSPRTAGALVVAQGAQDRGLTWGLALAEFKANL